MMNRKVMILCASLLMVGSAFAQKLDFNIGGRQLSQVNEDGYEGIALVDKPVLMLQLSDSVSMWVIATENKADLPLKSNWWKDGVQKYSKLICDGIVAYPRKQKGTVSVSVLLKGLKPGHHSLFAYHNNIDGTESGVLNVFLNGKSVISGVKQSNRAQKLSDCGQSYVSFDVKSGETVDVTYTAVSSPVYINAIVLDEQNPKLMASDPVPDNNDIHADADDGRITLAWKNPEGCIKSHLYVGASIDGMQEQKKDADTRTEFKVSGSLPYYWRVDEEYADGTVVKGDVWTFRPRRIAFPGAEGYGRFATGGRDGIVYHVTNLKDDNNPGSLRYGIENVHGSRTIVFDVGGTIVLNNRLACGDENVTIAGQTAPGNGILLARSPFGIGYESIIRFMRLRLGSGKTADGMGCAGARNSIFDHCSIGWTIDEAFSSRGAKNFTFQHNLISEALNIAGHQNYAVGKMHGYAATIGGDIGSYHHNLLVNCEGRNWSMGGGLDGAGYYAGRLDIFNNVCYNWYSRATDGGAYQVNFVNNYYKMGPSTKQKFIMRLQLEGTGKGSQSVYMSGNLRVDTNGVAVGDKLNETYRYELSPKQQLTWQPFVDKAFFPSYAHIESAKGAYKNVLSDAGCNEPVLDDHDKRIIRETLTCTTTFKGSKSGLPGLIDADTDAGGFTAYPVPEVSRPVDFDSDGDGMPDWWEKMKGTNPNSQKGDFSESDKYESNGYTQLENYLNWLALPHFFLKPGEKLKLNLKDYFAGYNANPQFSASQNFASGVDKSVLQIKQKGSVLIIKVGKGTSGLFGCSVTATDAENISSLSRQFNIAVF